MNKIKELERELQKLVNKDRNACVNGNFPLHEKQVEMINKKEKIRKNNAKYLSNFIWYLDRYSIDLHLCSSREQAYLLKAFQKSENAIKLSKTERDVRRECMRRTDYIDY